MSLQHFLLVYDHEQQRLLKSEVFKNAEEAIAAYSKAERENAAAKNLEVVLIGSDSIKTVERTHANYFAQQQAKSPYLVGL